MATVNIDILGISQLKWTGMGEFNSDDHYIYYCRQESLRRNGVAIMVNTRVRIDRNRKGVTVKFIITMGDVKDTSLMELGSMVHSHLQPWST